MKLILTPTDKIVELNGVPTRVWEGRTESGVRCHAHIALIGVPIDADAREFDRALREVKAPTPADPGVRAIPARMIL